ncbi:DNA helicase [Tanacetum coccineum]|uniref:ATP-dependent DNA helicase n=1 Tax=Tanacetum coccineum TaxID=301880 RepID=A0ABQ5BRN5_9ASTR
MSYVHPAAGDLFYQRMLLSHQKGCRSFRDIRTVNNVVYPTCRVACEALGLLGDDKEWETTLTEAASTAKPSELRTLLAHILTHCKVSNPLDLWKRTWNLMSNDIPYVASISLGIPNLHIHSSELVNYTKYELEACLNHCSRSLTDFEIPLPPEDLMSVLHNRLLMEEKSYNRKTFLWKAIIYALRTEGKIVLAVASSGIASLLLPSGRTAHSRFKLPLELTDSSVCSVTKNTQLATLLKETDLIIWDESPMNDRRCFETLDRTLRDIFDTPNKLFGGKTVMLGDDFRQTLPVKKSASRTEIISSSIVESYLWQSFKLFVLTENMRLTQANLSDAEKEEVLAFANWLLNVGDGTVGTPDETGPENTSWIDIPVKFQIADDENGLTNLIHSIYDDHTLLHPTAKGLQEKAIVCPQNDTADVINTKVMSTLPGQVTKYISHDEAVPHGHDGGEVELLYMTEYLNTLNFTGIPPHELELKIDTLNRAMEPFKDAGSSQHDKHKMILTEPEITNISELSAASYNNTIEAIGTPIQANMSLRDAEYFDQLLKLQKAYRFSGFSCEPTDNWERTLPTQITLIFGRFLQVEEIPNSDFPEHYFNFAAYNELPDRLSARNPILTDLRFAKRWAMGYTHEQILAFNW